MLSFIDISYRKYKKVKSNFFTHSWGLPQIDIINAVGKHRSYSFFRGCLLFIFAGNYSIPLG